MKTTKQYITLPAAIYDALHLSALAAGGVGSGCLDQQEFRGKKIVNNVPVCIIGHTLFLDGRPGGFAVGEEIGPVTAAVAKAFGFAPRMYINVFSKNDQPIVDYFDGTVGKAYGTTKSVSKQIGGDFCDLSVERKVSWKKWVNLVGVVRGGPRGGK